MSEIKLTNSVLSFKVDNIDFLYLMLLGPFHLQSSGYARSTRTFNKIQPYVHHIIAAKIYLMVNSNCEIDHKDRNKLNNSRNNLQIVNHSQNAINNNREPGISGERHIYWHNKTGKWKVQIMRTNKLHYLGLFDSVHEAVEARNFFLERMGDGLKSTRYTT